MQESVVEKCLKVIVLILSYNGKALLNDSVSSYLQNDYPNFEVVVIDNGSTDGTQEYIQQNYPDATVIRTEQNLGYSGAFNFGFNYAFDQKHADYVLVSNNDVKADRRVVSELVNVAESDANIGFVTGKVFYYDHPDTLQTVGKSEDSIRWSGDHIGNGQRDTGQFETICERAFADDIFTLVSRKMYENIGGYDTTFRFQSEEYDWQARARKAGYKIMYTPKAVIWHKESMTIGKDSAFKAFFDARNPMLVILKHQPPDFFRRYFWVHIWSGVLRAALVKLKQRRPDISVNILRGFISGLIWGVKHRKFTRRHFLNF